MKTKTGCATKTLHVIADVLNVRARPGVSADNPVIERLGKGDTVTSIARAPVNGETWHRIGNGRWVHGAWLSDTQPGCQDLINQNWLSKAEQATCMAEPSDAHLFAAIAQAEALTRIAEVLETMLDDQTHERTQRLRALAQGSALHVAAEGLGL